MPQLAECGETDQILEETNCNLKEAQPPTRVLLAVHVRGEPDGDSLPTFMSGSRGRKDENTLRVEATYKSSSDTTLFLVTAPLAVWQLLPDHEGCQFVSLITGGNLLRDYSTAGAETQSTAEEGIFSSPSREEDISASIPAHEETQVREPLSPPPPPPYSQRDVLNMD